MLKGIVLDFDGVIADTEPLHFRAFREVLAGEGVPLSEADYYSKYLGYSDAAAFNAIASDSGRSWDAAGIAALVGRKPSRMKALETDGMPLFPGAEAFVRDAARIAPLAIASGALRAEILRVLQHANLISCFAAIVGAEDA